MPSAKRHPFCRGLIWLMWHVDIKIVFLVIYSLEIIIQGPALLTLNSFYLKAFSRKHGCDWLMLKHQPITATLSAKSFLAKRLLALVTEAPVFPSV